MFTDTQTFTVSGGDVTIVDPNAISVASDDNQDDAQLNVTYTVTDAVVGADHSIELFAADNVTVDADGVVTLVAPTTGTLADNGTVDGTLFDIVSINGDAAAASGTQVQGFRPNSTTFTFTVQVDDASANVLGSVVPVVYFDDADGGFTGGVEVDADGVPAGDALFGVGGQIEVLPIELVTGALAGNATIDVVDTDRDILVLNAGTTPVHVSYADTDDFFVNPGGTAAKATAAHASDLAEFESRVSVGDELVGPSETVYSRTGVSEFVLDDLVPGVVAGVSATVLNDTSIDVAWTAVTAADSYTVYRAELDDLSVTDATTGNLVEADGDLFVEVGTVAGDDDPEFSDAGLTAATEYVYWVTQTQDGEESIFATGATVTATASTVAAETLAAGETALVVSNAATVTTDAFPTGSVNDGDVFEVGFNQPVALSGTWAIQVTGANGSTGIVNAGNSLNTTSVTFEGAVYAPGELLEITVAGGDAAGLTYPLTVTQTTGIAEDGTATNTWNLTSSADVVLDVDTTAGSVDNIAPTVVSVVETAADQITVTYTENVLAANGAGGTDTVLDFTQFTFNDGTTNFVAEGAAISTNTVVLTFNAASPIDSSNDVSEGTLSYTAPGTAADDGDVVDAALNPAPDQAATATSDPA